MHARTLRTVALLAGLTTIGDCRSDRTGRGDAYDAEVAPVVAAVGARRPIEGRLTGGFQYGEWRQVRGRERGLELEAAATRLRESGAGDRARAVGALLGGDSDAAIVGLERILSRPGWSASAASDLAAARLARWRRTGAALDAVRALNDADRAVAAEPGLPEGWFNRALALDALGLAGLAGEGWVRYGGLDPTSAWAAEAADRASRDERRVRASLEALRRGSVLRAATPRDTAHLAALATEDPRLAREELETHLIADWSTARLRGSDPPAAEAWRSLSALGRLLADRRGDRLWMDLAREMEAVPPRRQVALARALRDLSRARADVDANRFDSAAPIFTGLADRLADVPSAQLLADFWTQYTAWHRGDKSSVVRPLLRLRQRSGVRHFRYVEARCSLLLAASMESLARYEDAVAAFRRAIEAFEALDEVDFAASARAMLAHLLALQGDLNGAWEQQHAALDALPSMESSRQRVVVLANAVLLGAHHAAPFAALDIQAALIAEVRSWGDAGALARYYVERTRLCNDLRMPGMAQAALADGLRAVAAIPDASNRTIFDIDLQIEGARISMDSDPGEAARVLSGMVRTLPEQTGEFKLAEVYLDLGRAKQLGGDPTGALQAWLAGIDVFERQRSAIKGEALRISFYTRAWDLYESAISETIRQHRFESALSLVERSRARTLRDRLSPLAPFVDVRDLQSRLPAGTLLVIFASVRDSFLAWCVDRSRVAFAQLPYASDRLREQVDLVRAELLAGKDSETADRLATMLIAPFMPQLSSANHLILIPDGPLSSLPFAALRLPGQAESVVDRFSVTLAPSLSVFEVASRSLAATASRPPASGVFVGDPTLDRRVYPALNRLSSARTEIIESAKLYPRGRVFLGSDASASALTRALGSVDVIHFAGHALADADFPLRSTLSVAPESGRPGVMHMTDFERLTARGRTRLVILSACSTANGTAAFGEGTLSLARSFLAAGVPDVLGTLWDVDDGDAAALVPRFHRWLRAGFDPGDALRRAQLELKTGPDVRLRQPRAWSGFVIIGGSELLQGESRGHAIK